MSSIPAFQLEATPIETGTTLIEASAGTGKTFTIAGVVLRLVLEKAVPIERILAVTYTIAATGELRDRVRQRLQSALDDLRSGATADRIVERFLEPGARSRGIAALNLAVQDFDKAQIFTIHGFCQRILREHAFESSAPFEMELLPDPTPIFDEVAQDFWRRQFYRATALISRLALARERSPQQWSDLLNRLRNHPDLRILPERGRDDLPGIAERIEKILVRIVTEWNGRREEVQEILENDNRLSRDQKKLSRKRVEDILGQMETLAADPGGSSPEMLLAVWDLSNDGIAAGTKPSRAAPEHPFFDLCQEFADTVEAFFHELDRQFVDYAASELPARKTRRNICTFDDLLTRLRDALRGVSGGELTRLLGGRYQAALVDEFQDTDPVQYEIFQRVFGGGRHFLFLIGDPKQAIYGFRGADVFTYLQAAGDASRKFTLQTNFRSEKPLLEALNTVFSTTDDPFRHPEILYHPVGPPPASRHRLARLRASGAALRFRVLPPIEKPPGHAIAEEAIGRALVGDILQLHASDARLDGRRIGFGDMAVLVRANYQAVELQGLLRAAGIKSVIRVEQSVLGSEEAGEVLRVLRAILEPGRSSLLNAALATPMVSLDAAEILSLRDNEMARQKWLERFLDYRGRWEADCFGVMFRHLLNDLGVRERLAEWTSGERRLTNLLHVGELLHQAEADERMTPGALCAWLRKHGQRSATPAEEHQLRLESDEDAVLLSTIHKSKGLEYPIVFCPFLWKPARAGEEILFHDPAANNRLTLDLRKKAKASEHAERTRQEALAESLRLLYVALTRARNRCYVYGGDISKIEESPLCHVLGASLLRGAFESVAGRSGGTIDVTVIGAEKQAVPMQDSFASDDTRLAARPFQGTVSQTRMIASFTGLISDRADEEPDRDAIGAEGGEGELDEGGLAGLQGGVRTGVFLHDVLEHLDFQEPDGIERLVSAKLASHGLETFARRDDLCALIRRLLTIPLEDGLTLDRISLANRLSEVEFSYPVRSLRPERLRAFFSARDALPPAFPSGLGRLQFRPVEGYMRGFIDLLFDFSGKYYLVDWKSNWLGSRLRDYEPDRLHAAMQRSFYFLQYHLYTVAADLFLSRRVRDYRYETHFGGVFYIFLRGIGTAGSGVFRDRPAADLVSGLRGMLLNP